MTAAELYEIVKDDPEVWDGWIALDKGKFASLWRDLTNGNVLCSPLAEAALEALYARATGCGVYLSRYARGDQEYVAERPGFFMVHRGPTRLAALVAAYRANKETKR